MRCRCAALLVAILLIALASSAPAFAWSNGGDGGDSFGTHDWILQEGSGMVVDRGVTWLDLPAALTHTDDPDSEFHDFANHMYERWNGKHYGAGPKKVAEWFALAQADLAKGNYLQANIDIGILAHYYGDLCNPLHTDRSAAEDKIHSRYEDAVEELTDVPEENAAWASFESTVTVNDPNAFAVQAATAAHADYAALVKNFSKRGMNAVVMTITERSLDRAANGVANLLLSLGRSLVAPSITSFTPTSGPAGTQVTINGSGFTAATDVKFNGTPAFFTFVSPNQVTATVPTGATSGPISITTPGGTGTSVTRFSFGFLPLISNFSPSSGSVGTVVNVYGSALSGTTSVTFNGSAAAFTCVSPTQVTATVPAGASTGPIRVTTAVGTVTSSLAFTVLSASSGGGGTIVYVTDTGAKYHRAGCQYLSHSQHAMTLAQAKAAGYTPCSVCKPPQ